MGHNLGTLSHARHLQESEHEKTGLAYIQARLSHLNFLYCWGGPACQERWRQVNRHLWRIRALYHGGDCFLAGWPGAVPHQRLYPSRCIGERHALPAWREGQSQQEAP